MNRLKQTWYLVRSSFWFLPGLLVCAGVMLAIVMAEVDSWVPQQWLDRWPRLFGAGAEGARGLLSAIASSMINVAGVVFSITLVALSLTSSQYSSRVLRNFMRDPINQSVLGMFLGIFAYCLIVLRTIRDNGDFTFIPSLSILVGLLLGFVGLGYLIFFIHHIAISIQASHILAEVAEETQRIIKRVYTTAEVLCDRELEHLPDRFGKSWVGVKARSSGYLQAIDVPLLVAFAEETDRVIRWHYSVGDFIVQDVPVLSVLTVGELEEADRLLLHSSYRVGRERTLEQDVAYGIRQLVDLALKALSPGINDTTTALMSLDYLTAILVQLSACEIDVCYRNEQQAVRVLIPGPDFETYLKLALNQIRENAAGNSAVLRSLIHTLQVLSEKNSSPLRSHSLQRQQAALQEIITRTIPAPETCRELLQQLASHPLPASGSGSCT